jgi:hypothetical protein
MLQQIVWSSYYGYYFENLVLGLPEMFSKTMWSLNYLVLYSCFSFSHQYHIIHFLWVIILGWLTNWFSNFSSLKVLRCNFTCYMSMIYGPDFFWFYAGWVLLLILLVICLVQIFCQLLWLLACWEGCEA